MDISTASQQCLLKNKITPHNPDYILQDTTSSADKGDSRDIMCLDFYNIFYWAQNNLMKILEQYINNKFQFKHIRQQPNLKK